MMKHVGGVARRTGKLSLGITLGIIMATFVASANQLSGYDPNPIPVVFEEPQGVSRDDAVSTPEEDSARPLNAPALPADPTNPSRRCGNVGNMLLDVDDLCQYAGAARTASATIVVPQ